MSYIVYPSLIFAITANASSVKFPVSSVYTNCPGKNSANHCSFFRKIGGKRLPENLVFLQRRLARLCFNDFWKAEIFDREAFLNEAWPIYEAGKEQSWSMRKLISFALMQSEDNQYTIRQKRLARKFAKTLDSKKLLRHLEKGKFSKPFAINGAPQK